MVAGTRNRRGRVTFTKKEAAQFFRLGIVGQEAPFPEYADDPVGFLREILKIRHITKRQVQICLSVLENRVTNVPAGFNVGKTFIAAGIVMWWVFARGGFVVTTAPTERQVKRLLWREIRKHYDAHAFKFGGTRDLMQLYLSEDAQAFGFSASDYDEESAAGFHDPNLLAIIDEANGVSMPLDNAVTGWTSGQKNRLLRIGNPTKDGTAFSKACMAQGAIQISCFDHPNTEWAYDTYGVMLPKIADGVMVTAPNGLPTVRPREEWPKSLQERVEDPIDGAISVEWIESTRTSLDRGEGTSYWQGRVLGLFPSDSATSLIPRTWFKAARKRYDDNPAKWDKENAGEPWHHGLDVGDGIDDHARGSRRGDVLYELEIVPTKGDRKDISRAVGMIFATNDGGPDRKAKPGIWNVDRIGVGTGVVSFVMSANDELEPGEEDGYIDVHGIHFGSKRMTPKQKKMFRNVRCMALWTLRVRCEEGELAIAPLGAAIEQRLMEELANLTWEHDVTGKVVVVAKKVVKDLLGRSPDAGDAVAMAFMQTGPTQTKASHW